VLAHHYLWYGTPWGPTGRWSHWDHAGRHPDHVVQGRRDIAAAFTPLGDVYDSRDPAVLRRQVAELREAGVDGSIVSWWGMDHPESGDLALLLSEAERAGHCVTIYYESLGLVAWEGKSSLERSWKPAAELREVLARYGGSPAWLRVGDRPVIGLYVVDKDPALWAHVREQLADFEPFFLADVGEDVLGDGRQACPSWLGQFDAIHAYLPLSLLEGGRAVGPAYRRLADAAHAAGRLFAGTAVAGFDYRATIAPPRAVARADGATLRATWRAAVEADADWMLVTSYNEWGDGTQIEPTEEYGRDYVDLVGQLAQAFRRR
jgi:glycoprotein endo-alpha-1,2-mannosidase